MKIMACLPPLGHMLPCKNCSMAYLAGAYSFNTFPILEMLTSKLLSCLALHSSGRAEKESEN